VGLIHRQVSFSRLRHGVMCILRDVTFIRIRNERVVLQSIQMII
jgi:hypothetical protein